jgi:Aldo/keto reductase family
VSTRRLGNSDLNITPVGFGTWAIGHRLRLCLGKEDDADSIAAVHRSLELGVNWIDTAHVYGTGHSEEIVAGALKECRGSRPYVFTKCVMRRDEKGRVTTVFNCVSIRRECDDSLRRLHVDVIDLYQMHWPPADNGPDWRKLGKQCRSPIHRCELQPADPIENSDARCRRADNRRRERPLPLRLWCADRNCWIEHRRRRPTPVRSDWPPPLYRAPRMPPRNPYPPGRRHLSTRPFEWSPLTHRLG